MIRPVNNPINIFLGIIKYLWISKISLWPIGLKLREINFTTLFNPVYFILWNVKSFQTLPKHSA